MALHYHVDIARFASNADSKWVDNLLSKFDVPGTEASRQGINRRLSTLGVYHIVLTWRLCRVLRLQTADALALAIQLLSTDAASLALGNGLEIRFDRRAFDRDVNDLIAQAVESVVPPRRGRPPKNSVQL